MSSAVSSEIDPQLSSDRLLLQRFVQQRDEAAFAELVRRHGDLVFGVCRRVLRSATDADDAFQATFLVLARRAGALKWQESIAGWLYQTARRTALKARQTRLVRSRREAESVERVVPGGTPQQSSSVSDVAEVLDAELQRLPENLQSAIVLCHLEGLSRQEAADRLGITAGAVKDRLERGRELLRTCLSRRGIALTAALVASTFAASSAQAASASWGVAQACTVYATGQSMAGVVSASVVSLSEGVLKMMFFEKLKTAAVGLVSFVLLSAFAYGMLVDTPDRFEKGIRGTVLSVDASASQATITVMLEEFETPLSLDVAADVKVAVAFADGKLSEIATGSRVSLRLAGDHRTVKEIHAAGETLPAVVQGLSPNGESLTLQFGDDEEELAPEKIVPLAADAILRIGGLPAGRQQLVRGMHVIVEMAKDGKTINAVEGHVEDDRIIDGDLLSIDAPGKSLQVRREVDDAAVETWIKIDAEKLIRVDGKPASLERLPPGATFRARLTSDRTTIEALTATSPEPDDEEPAEEREQE